MSKTEHNEYDVCQSITTWLKEHTKCRPVVGIVCGSGLGCLADMVENAEVFPYEDIPDFPVSTVAGHAGKLVFGTIEGKPVVCMKGRFHPYEGYSSNVVVRPIRVFALLDVKVLMLTNAAGGLSESLRRSDIMLITDHINLPGLGYNNPLFGPNDERFGTRFPPMSNTYSEALRKQIVLSAQSINQEIQTGVYCHVGGPSFETPAECRFLRTIGADAVGMSTVPEVIVAHHMGVQVCALSLITNEAIMSKRSVSIGSHAEVLATANAAEKNVVRLVCQFVKDVEV